MALRHSRYRGHAGGAREVGSYTYDQWGKLLTVSESVPQQLRYAGYWYDNELGWYWLSVRAYDPVLARFTQPDPSEQEGLFSYVYVGDSPSDMVDASGLSVAIPLQSGTLVTPDPGSFFENNVAVNSPEWNLEITNGTTPSGGPVGALLAALVPSICDLAPQICTLSGRFSRAGSRALAAQGFTAFDTTPTPTPTPTPRQTPSLTSQESLDLGAIVTVVGVVVGVVAVVAGAAWLALNPPGDNPEEETPPIDIPAANGVPAEDNAVSQAIGATERDARSVTNFADKAAARQALSGVLRQAANRFFRDAAANGRDFKVLELDNGSYRFEFFSPARNPGYGKLYVREVDREGAIIREYKDTLGPNGLIERKWVHGE